MLAAVVAGATAGVPAVAHAQVRGVPNGVGGQPAAVTGGTVVSPVNPGANVNVGVNNYPSPGYAPPYYGPYMGQYGLGNTLQGAASVINAQGQFNIQNQQAKLAQQQVEQSKVDTRRKQFEEYKYEQANTPTVNDIREAQMQADLRRQRNDPPKAEIWSGDALNGLLKVVQREQAGTGMMGPAIPLDPDVVRQLNVTSGVAGSGSGIGALKGSELSWPLSLAKPTFQADRKKIDDLANQLVLQAASGKVDPATLQKAEDATTALKGKVKDKIEEMTPNENIKANRFCNELMGAFRTLEDPAAVNSFNGKWSIQARSVPELVVQMQQKGLTFAPCVAGQESAYTAAYQALVSYDMALGQMTARLQSPGRGGPPR